MASKKEIRKIEIKIPLNGWKWIDTVEMTLDTAIAQAKQAVSAPENNGAFGVKISKLGRIWTTEFEGDQNFNYIGVEL